MRRVIPGMEFSLPRSLGKPSPSSSLERSRRSTCLNFARTAFKVDSPGQMSEVLYQIMGRHRVEPLPERKPSWLKVKAPGGPNYLRLKHMMRELDLHSVCEEAHCPNVGECWEHGTATFMILGDVCTRNCAYCAVAHGRPPKYDPAEPERVAAAAAQMKLQHLVITSVDRDDLPDFG